MHCGLYHGTTASPLPPPRNSPNASWHEIGVELAEHETLWLFPLAVHLQTPRMCEKPLWYCFNQNHGYNSRSVYALEGKQASHLR